MPEITKRKIQRVSFWNDACGTFGRLERKNPEFSFPLIETSNIKHRVIIGLRIKPKVRRLRFDDSFALRLRVSIDGPSIWQPLRLQEIAAKKIKFKIFLRPSRKRGCLGASFDVSTQRCKIFRNRKPRRRQ